MTLEDKIQYLLEKVSNQLSEQHADTESIISLLESLISLLKQQLKKSDLHGTHHRIVGGILHKHPLYNDMQSHRTFVPQVKMLEPSKPHKNDIVCSSLIPKK